MSRDFVETLFPAALYRLVYSLCPGLDVTCRVKKICVPPVNKSFFFFLFFNSGILSVKPWLRGNRLFDAWSADCPLCNMPETIERVLIYCWDEVFVWDILQRKLKKICVYNPRETIRFRPVDDSNTVPYDLFILHGSFSLWKTRTEFRLADSHINSARVHLIEEVTQVQSVHWKTADSAPYWAQLFEELKHTKEV